MNLAIGTIRRKPVEEIRHIHPALSHFLSAGGGLMFDITAKGNTTRNIQRTPKRGVAEKPRDWIMLPS